MIRRITYRAATPETPTAVNWRLRGACTEVDPELMFPSTKQVEIDAAKDVCRRCPVLAQCLKDILAAEGGKDPAARHGIVAGLTPTERRKIWRQSKKDTA
ncbi:WhiB family transcriptional regulator [Streptomyces sp. KL116D]|uniref:WhiB family transcriptional regulator n=1 Tax=Streptomyces sp. KL116D TaxID=3045152 RepID=UPI0035563827